MIMANGQSFTLSMFSATSIGLGDIVPGFRIKANYDQDNISRESATQITLVWFYLVYISLGEFDQNTIHSLRRGGREGEGRRGGSPFGSLRVYGRTDGRK